MAVQRDGAAVHIVEAHEQLDHRGLAGAGGADDSNLLAGLDIAAEIVNNCLFLRVAEFDMVEGDLTVNVGGVGAMGRVSLLILLRFVQKLKDAFGGGSHALQHIGYLRQLLDGLGKVLDVLDKGLNITDGDGARGGKDAAHNGHRHIAEVAHKVHDGLHQAGQKLGFPCGFIEFVIGGVEILQHGGLAVEGLDDVVAGVDLLHLAVDNTQRGLLRLEVFLAEFDNQQHQPQRDRQDQQGNQRHFRADREHHNQHANHRGDACDELGHALVQALPQRVDIVGNAGKHLTDGAFFKVSKRQAVDFFTDLVAEVIADLLGKAAHNPALYKAEQRGKQIHGQQEQQYLADIGKVDAAGAAQLGNPACGQRGGGLCKDFRPCNVENGGKNGKYNNHDERQLILAHGGQQLTQRALEILGALGCGASGSWHITHPPSADSVPSGSAGCGQSPDIRGSSPSAGRACPCQRCGPHPAPESGWRAARWKCAVPQ